MKTIITIQHTQSEHHNTKMVGSWTDWELTDLGRTHAENIGRNLSEELISTGQTFKIYSSDLKRAVQTVEPLAKYMGIEISCMKDLREHNLGEAVGKSGEWARNNSLPGTGSFDARQFHGAESWREFWNRVSDVCNRIINDEAENIIIASHGVTLSVWQKVWMGFDIQPFVYTGHPGGVSHLTVDDKGQRNIYRWNDTVFMKKI